MPHLSMRDKHQFGDFIAYFLDSLATGNQFPKLKADEADCVFALHKSSLGSPYIDVHGRIYWDRAPNWNCIHKHQSISRTRR
jgi:hypothetical protein